MSNRLNAPLIALCGKMKSGKTTLAIELADRLNVTVDSFAAPLKAGCKAFGFVVDGPNKDRFVLQNVASFVRQNAPDHWIKQMIKRHPDCQTSGLIIDDCRYLNEFNFLKANGFLMVRLIIAPETQIARGASASGFSHESETDLDNIPAEYWDLVLSEASSVNYRAKAIMQALIAQGIRNSQAA
jgi:hypothetical protein